MSEQVRLLHVNGRLEIELAGTLAGIPAHHQQNPRRDPRGLHVMVVAGERNRRYLQGLVSRIPTVNRPLSR